MYGICFKLLREKSHKKGKKAVFEINVPGNEKFSNLVRFNV